MKKYRFFVLTLLFASILASLTSYNVSALSFSASDTRSYSAVNSNGSGIFLTNAEGTSYFDYANSGSGLVFTFSNGGLNLGWSSNTNNINGVRLAFTSKTPDKYIMNVAYRFCPTNPDQLRSWIGFSSDAYNSILSQDWIINGSCVSGSISVFGSISRYYVNLGYTGGGLLTGNVNAGGSFVFNIANFIVLSDDADYSSVLSAIKNNTDGIADTLSTMSSDMSSLRSAQEQEAQTAQDTYDKTIEDEQTASSSAGGFSFNFSIPNPFEIFRVSDGCVSTPTIDSWLHLEGDWQSPHCPVIPAEVRNTLTPVVTLIVTLATLLVVIRWVSGTAVDVAGNSSWLNDKPEKGAK